MNDDDLEATNMNPTPDLVIGDSWFSSVDLCENMTKNYIGVVKTNHSRYPKAFLQSKMQTWPAGSHLLLRTVLNKGRNSEKVIFALGYKYCKAKVLFFIFTEGAGHTECRKEYAYEAKWKDENLNTRTRMIDRPHVCHLYFSNCNVIDVLNQSRQSDLKLEKHWITTNGFFRIATSLFGITVVDAWKGYVWHCGPNHRNKKINLLNFVDMLCKDMLNNRFSNDVQHRNTTYSIRPPAPSTNSIRTPAPSNKRHAFEIEERPSPVARGASDSELLSYDPSNEDNTPFEMMNDSQISDISMGPTDFPPSPSRNHCLVRTRQMESYSYSRILPSGC